MSRQESATPLGKVRGLGSAREGGGHWLEERFTSVALLLLGLWLIASLVMLPDLNRPTLIEWLRMPLGAVPMGLFVLAAFVHARDGLKVVIDDYVHDEGNRVALHFVVAMAAIFGLSLSLFFLAKIALGAA